ncbi:hypothetical protein B0H34DRAFT_792216 [Crassisporium funariophilum]|nr:hypothetical protein B0H34DRAFT_792216 [Crassisporium funariophilum]
MSLDTSLPNNSANAIDEDALNAAQTNIHSIEEDINQMSKLLSGSPSLLGGDDVAELLHRLTSADSMAQGMESKLDGMLENLDQLLASLGDGEGTAAASNVSKAQDESGSISTDSSKGSEAPSVADDG